MYRWLRALAISSFLGASLATAEATAQPALVVALGDSNTAGFGVSPYQAYPAQLEALLRARGQGVQVYSAGINGDTTRGMLRRLNHAVPRRTRHVIVQGGYNDLMSGSSPDVISRTIDIILSHLSARGAGAVLCGSIRPDWDALGKDIARRYGAAFVDGGTCYDPSYRGSDGLHMTAAGHQVVAARLLPVVEAMLRRRRQLASHSR